MDHITPVGYAESSQLATPRMPVSRPETALSGASSIDSPFKRALDRNSRTTSPAFQASTSAFHLPAVAGQRYFRSRRIKDVSTLEKPWTAIKDPKKKWHTIIPLIGVFAGLAVVAIECWQGFNSVINHDYCLILQEDFSGGTLDENIWTKEVQSGGFGNGQFDMTTSTDENVFVKDGELWIKPTLQDEALITHNNEIDLRSNGLCTSTEWKDCYAVTNTTNGTIVNPVKSGRINTKKGATIQYGRIEVEALMPEGDWMWPAIWMLPVDSKYGDWPASGEIDIAESRGNNYTYKLGGNNVVSSTLHWGPASDFDAWYQTFTKREASHTTFAKTWHKFGLEWTDKYLFTYVDSRLHQALYVPFNKPLWPQGNFDSATSNGTRIVDPWSQTGHASTPFDESFYLILDVSVGSTNSWWQDGLQSKPWVDSSPTAMKDFWDARDQWYPTWQDNGQLRVRNIKIWQQAGFRGCQGK